MYIHGFVQICIVLQVETWIVCEKFKHLSLNGHGRTIPVRYIYLKERLITTKPLSKSKDNTSKLLQTTNPLNAWPLPGRLFWAKAFPLIILLIWNSSSRYNFNVFGHDAAWALNQSNYLPNADQMRYVLYYLELLQYLDMYTLWAILFLRKYSITSNTFLNK